MYDNHNCIIEDFLPFWFSVYKATGNNGRLDLVFI